MRGSYRDAGLILGLVAIVVAGALWASGYTEEFFRRISWLLSWP